MNEYEILFRKSNEFFELFESIPDPFIHALFEVGNYERIDEKIELLKKLNDGKRLEDIDGWEKIVDNPPKEDGIWDW